ncbi:MAG: hydroxyisourate hydrolase [Verrucomicrobiota bacterium]
MSGKLSTHVLDTYSGKPAAGIPWVLEFKSETDGWVRLNEGITNSDGRTDAPLLEGGRLVSGLYRIVFRVGGYFAGFVDDLPETPFLDEIAIQVGLEAGGRYHVPLLTSPWSYSTYRGS